MQRKLSEHSATGTAPAPREVEHPQRGGQSYHPDREKEGSSRTGAKAWGRVCPPEGTDGKGTGLQEGRCLLWNENLTWVQHGMWAYLGRRDKAGTGSKGLDYEGKELSTI